MKLQKPKLMPSIDADLAIGVINRNIEALKEPDAPIQTGFVYCGVHERTAKGDEMTLSFASSAKRTSITYNLKRDSLYHILPEYIFHPLDRYANCEGDKDSFLEKRTVQKEIEKNALEYFQPFDIALTRLRVRFQDFLNASVLNNDSFVTNFILENEDIDKDNEYIRRCIPYILYLRDNRGSKALIALVINAIFGSNLVDFSYENIELPIEIDSSLCHITLDDSIDTLFCGESIVDQVEIIRIRHQVELKSIDDIMRTSNDIDGFSQFFTKWFLSDSQAIDIIFGDFTKEPVISENTIDGELLLNYNTQLLVS